MRLLLDTHLLLWASAEPHRLSSEARILMEDAANHLCFSAASLWEIAIKSGLGRTDFQVDAALLKHGLVQNGDIEMPITGTHAVAVGVLPTHHEDPFDRILVAQANVGGITLLTADPLLAHYGPPVRSV